MNSVSLYRHFATHEKYKELFAHSAVVCSAPGVFFWCGEHNVLGGGISVCQAFPLRVWVGLEPGSQLQKIEIAYEHLILNAVKPPFHFDLSGRNEYGRDEYITFAKEKVSKQEALVSEVKKMCASVDLSLSSFRVHVLSEFPPCQGANWSGAFSSALAGAVLALNHKIDSRDIERWQDTPAFKLDKDTLFRLCNRWAWHFETILHGGAASGYGTFASLVGGEWPICFYTEQRRAGGSPPINVIRDGGAFPWDSQRTWIEGLNYSGFRFDDVFEVKYPPALYGLLSTGTLKDTATSITIRQTLSRHIEEARLDILSFFEERKEVLGTIEPEKVAFLKLCDSDGKELMRHYNNGLSVSCLEAFYCVHRLFTSSSDTNVFLDLNRVLGGIHGSLTQTGQNWPLGHRLAGELLCIAEELEIGREIGVKLTGGGGGGFLFFVVPQRGEDRKEKGFLSRLLRRIEVLQQEKLSARINLSWISSRDGLEAKGLRIEMPFGRTSHKNDLFEVVATFPLQTVLWSHKNGKVEKRMRYEFEINFLKDLEEMIYIDFRKSVPSDQQLKLGGISYATFSNHGPVIPTAKILANLISAPERTQGIDTLVELVGTSYTPSHIREYCKKLEELAYAKRGIELEFVEIGRRQIHIDPLGCDVLIVS